MINEELIKKVIKDNGMSNGGKEFSDPQITLFTKLCGYVEEVIKSELPTTNNNAQELNCRWAKNAVVFSLDNSTKDKFSVVTLKDGTINKGLLSFVDLFTVELSVFGKVDKIKLSPTDISDLKIVDE